MYPILNQPREIILNPENAGLVVTMQNKRLVATINHTAASILEQCNGQNTVEDIINILAKKYSESYSTVSILVNEFLDYSLGLKTIKMSNQINPKTITVYGDYSYWIPSVISLELTYKCPLLCKHCYREASMEYCNFIAVDDVERIASEMKKLGIMYIQLTGGEPFIHPNIEEIIEIFAKKEIMISIVTSGYILRNSIFFKLNEHRNFIATIQVSIDGLERTHNLIRQKKDSYTKAIKFIKKLVENKLPVDVGTSIIDQNKDEIYELSKNLKLLNVNRHRLGIVMNTGRSSTNELELTKPPEIARWTQEFNDLLGNDNFQIVEEEEFSELPNGKKRCGAGYQLIRISPSLIIYPCPIFDLPIYNYSKGSLIDFIRTKTMKFYKMAVPNKNTCGSCSLLEICSQCPAQAMIEKENAQACFWYSMEKETIEGLSLTKL